MSENPPPPPGEAPPPRRDFDPRRRSPFPPKEPLPAEPLGCAGVLGLAVLGLFSFLLTIGVIASTIASSQPVVGAVIVIVAIVALFVIRKRAGPSRPLGAVIVGVGVAIAVFGGCMLILATMKLDFR